jgi:hypothetical protein
MSGLSGSELQLAYNTLLEVKRTLVYEESEGADPNEPAPGDFEQELDTLLSLLGSRLEGPQV